MSGPDEDPSDVVTGPPGGGRLYDQAVPNGHSASTYYDASTPPFEERPLQSSREQAAARAAEDAVGEPGPAMPGRARLAAAGVAVLAALLLLGRRRRRHRRS